ncbi:hypothetical protein [Bradyrhizobium sp. CB2312]|uniref:hypothetical protein n=1 Tax=Bradyrhizobium sp. CB2312 TaxID=3039155 RepID=UPI0024B0C7B5|nr:hypothetical protein [Bradyrhizobium sp. CB2312]WFU74643.1 hypothetical protein QA642_11570 [Bradyrhizobium sp. CB2312]
MLLFDGASSVDAPFCSSGSNVTSLAGSLAGQIFPITASALQSFSPWMEQWRYRIDGEKKDRS